MKHFFFTAILFCFIAKTSFAQTGMDTLLFENFELNPDSAFPIGIPSGFDTYGLNYDGDQIPDASGGSRPDQWYWAFGFADVDSSNSVYWSNSWTYNPDPIANYLILPPIQIIDTTAKLSWKSAPRQTPRYLDGYYVVVSTTCNVEDCYPDTLFKAAEYLSVDALDEDSGFSHYDFSPGWVHGEDGTYTEYHNDSARFIGILKPFTVSLAPYSGQTIYIAIVHGTHDDNLLSIDDILVTGTTLTGIHDPNASRELLVFPNPASDIISMQFNLPRTSGVSIDVVNAEGKIVKSQEAGTFIKGNEKITMNVGGIAAGTYQLVVHTNSGDFVRKIEVQ